MPNVQDQAHLGPGGESENCYDTHNTYSVVHVNVSAEFECERVTNSRTNTQSTQYMYT